jgi:hypothetical protein
MAIQLEAFEKGDVYIDYAFEDAPAAARMPGVRGGNGGNPCASPPGRSTSVLRGSARTDLASGSAFTSRVLDRSKSTKSESTVRFRESDRLARARRHERRISAGPAHAGPTRSTAMNVRRRANASWAEKPCQRNRAAPTEEWRRRCFKHEAVGTSRRGAEAWRDDGRAGPLIVSPHRHVAARVPGRGGLPRTSVGLRGATPTSGRARDRRNPNPPRQS